MVVENLVATTHSSGSRWRNRREGRGVAGSLVLLEAQCFRTCQNDAAAATAAAAAAGANIVNQNNLL
jgi:hypothetical protein